MKFRCTRCQGVNDKDAKFCNQCGAPLVYSDQRVTRPPHLPEEDLLRDHTPERPGDLHVSGPVTGLNQRKADLSSGSVEGISRTLGGDWDTEHGQTVQPLPNKYDMPNPRGASDETPTFPLKWTAKGKEVIGEAREFRERQEGVGAAAKTIWTFRVERYDPSGNRLQPVPVEMSGNCFHGSVSDGDWVQVPGSWRAGGLMKSKCVINLTTGASVKAVVPWTYRIANLIGFFIFVVIFAAVLAFILAAVGVFH